MTLKPPFPTLGTAVRRRAVDDKYVFAPQRELPGREIGLDEAAEAEAVKAPEERPRQDEGLATREVVEGLAHDGRRHIFSGPVADAIAAVLDDQEDAAALRPGAEERRDPVEASQIFEKDDLDVQFARSPSRLSRAPFGPGREKGVSMSSASTCEFGDGMCQGKCPLFENSTGDDLSSKNESKRVKTDRDTSLER